MREKKDNPSIMRSRWGKRRGWELQRLRIGARREVFWRKAWRSGGCCPATHEEVVLWKMLPKELTEPMKEKSRG